MAHTKDLTQGNIYKHLIQLSIPLIFGNILQQFYNTIDAFVVGRYAGSPEFAAIGIAGTVMNLFLFIIVGACTGLSVLFAHYYGLKDYQNLRRQHFSALLSGLSVSVLLGLLGLSGSHLILAFIQTPAELSGYVTLYLRWIFISLPAAFLYNMYASALRASGDTTASLAILSVAVTANLILDFLLVGFCSLGIEGAALATALTQLFSAILCILYMKLFHPELLLTRKDCHTDASFLKNTLKCSFATAMHQAGLYIGKMLVQGTVNTAGTEIIAAYTAATRIEGFANSFGDSGSAATSVIISQNHASGDGKRVKKAFLSSLTLTAGLGVICSILLFACAPFFNALMLGAREGASFSNAVIYLKVIALFYTLCFTGGSFTGYFNGIGKVFLTLIGSLLQISIRVVLSWVFFADHKLSAVAAATGIGWLTVNLFWGICKKKMC